MPISDTSFTGGSDPFTELTKCLNELSKVDLDAQFIDAQGKVKLTRDYLEMIISQYAQSTQNASIFNKFLGIDTKLDKALKEYKSDIQIMITGLSSMGSAQQTLQAPIADPQAMASMPQTPGGVPPGGMPQQPGPSQALNQAANQANARSLPVQKN